MNRVRLYQGLLVMLLAAAAAGVTPSGSPANDRDATWDSFRLILDRNIFARNRSAPSRVRPPGIQPPPGNEEHFLVLTGVVVREDERVAFFEDARAGETIRAYVGDSLGDGSLASITLDGVEYRSGNSTRRISVGENLAGLTTALYATTAASQPAATTMPEATTLPDAASKPSSGTDKGANDILERMRQQHLQENKQ